MILDSHIIYANTSKDIYGDEILTVVRHNHCLNEEQEIVISRVVEKYKNGDMISIEHDLPVRTGVRFDEFISEDEILLK